MDVLLDTKADKAATYTKTEIDNMIVGGSTDFVITVTRANNTWSIDRTTDEVLAAYDVGNSITIIVNYNNDVYVLRDFQESRQIYSYDNELQLAAILPDMNDAADTVNKFSISTFVFSASDTVDFGKRVAACIYKNAYIISDDGTISGTKTEVR